MKKFTVDVMQHVVQVSPDLAPTEVWTYAVNGKAYRGTAASPPIVVNEGDKVAITFVNGGSKAMDVNMPHSIDFHSAEVAPEQVLHRHRARQEPDDPLHRQAPRRVHVPLRDPARADARRATGWWG